MRGKCMNTFTIDARNAIARLAAQERPTRDVEKFASEKELSKLAAKWPSRRLVETWNGMPGVQRVAKFRDRTTAVRRLWTKAQELRPVQASLPARDGTKAARGQRGLY